MFTLGTVYWLSHLPRPLNKCLKTRFRYMYFFFFSFLGYLNSSVRIFNSGANNNGFLGLEREFLKQFWNIHWRH